MVRFVSRVILAMVLSVILAGTMGMVFGSACSPDCTCGCNNGGNCNCVPFTWAIVAGTDEDEIACWRGSVQVGSWRVSDQQYFPRFGPGKWGKPCEPPCAVPEKYVTKVRNFGVDEGKRDGKEHWRVNGAEVPRETAIKAMDAPALPDDANLPFVVAVGLPADQASRLVADVGNLARVQLYAADDVMAKDRDGKQLYTPGLWFVKADGAAVAHEAQYTGPDQLAEGLRRCDPKWNPTIVPDLSSVPSSGLVPDLAAVVGGGAGIGSLLGLVLAAFKRRKS